MRYLILLPLLFLSGCVTAPMPGYISRVDHPYDRRFSVGFEKIVSSTMYVLKKSGWVVDSEADPAIYERDDRYDNNGFQGLLIITRARKSPLSMTSMHLNVVIHSIGDTSDVEVRYEAQTPMIKRFTSERNDKVVSGFLNALEQDVDG
jgi:hypothetical protein